MLKKGGTYFVQKKTTDKSASGQIYFYLKWLSKEGFVRSDNKSS